MKPIFNKKEISILKYIGNQRRFLTINEIAVNSGFSWITTKKYLNNLYKDNLLQIEKEKYRIDMEGVYGK